MRRSLVLSIVAISGALVAATPSTAAKSPGSHGGSSVAPAWVKGYAVTPSWVKGFAVAPGWIRAFDVAPGWVKGFQLAPGRSRGERMIQFGGHVHPVAPR